MTLIYEVRYLPFSCILYIGSHLHLLQTGKNCLRNVELSVFDVKICFFPNVIRISMVANDGTCSSIYIDLLCNQC